MTSVEQVAVLIENYLKSDDKQKYLATLVKGSNVYQNLTIQHILNTRQHLLTKDDQQMLKSILDREYHSVDNYGSKNHQFELMKLLYELSDPQINTERASKIILRLREGYFRITYNHNQPSDITGKNLSQGGSDIPSQLDKEILDYRELLKLASDDYGQISSVINTGILAELDTSKLLKAKQVEVLQHFMRNADVQGLGDVAIDIIKEIIQRRSTDKYKHAVEFSYYKKLTIHQMQILADQHSDVKEDQNFISCLFTKKFSKGLRFFFRKKNADLNPTELQEKQRNFLHALEWVEQSVSPKMYSLGEQLFLEVFTIEMQQGIFDEARFQRYLDTAPRGFYGISYTEARRKLMEGKKKEYDRFWETLYGSLNQFWLSDDALIKTFLSHIFATAKSFKPYDDYLSNDYLNDLFYSTKLLQGDKIPDISQYLSPSRITELTEKKEITFTSKNKNYYTPGEDIQIELDFQNVPQFTISIYEVNSEIYFREKLAPFDNSLSLEGIIPKEQILVEEQDFSAIVKKRVKYPIKSISSQKRGIFIIDVMGNGLSSRAVIRKGGLTVLEEYTLAGHRLTIISEDREICTPGQIKGDSSIAAANETGIWLKKRFMAADANGVVLVPFSVDRSENCPIVICHEGFADIGTLNLKTEEYDFKCTYILNEESFLRGTKGKFLIQARLYINGVPTTMNAVSDQEVQVTTMNSEGIPLSFTFPTKFDHRQEAEFEIPVKDLLSNISIRVTGKVKNTFSGKPVPLASSFDQTFNLHLSDQFVNLYLKNTIESGYQVYLLGKNGEPKANNVITLNFRSAYFNKEQNVTLQTDQNGAVSLGRLSHVSTVVASVRNVGDSTAVSKTWQLNQNQVHLDYPAEITFVVGDTVTLPFKSDKVELSNVSFFERSEDDAANNINFLNKSLKLEGQTLKIGPLLQGVYNLDIKKPTRKTIILRVIKGKYWQKNKSFIHYERENRICESVGNSTNDICIEDVKVQANKDPKVNPTLRIKVHLPENSTVPAVREAIRVHVFARQFLPSQHTVNVNGLRNNQRAPLISSATFGLKKSIYLNNKQLGDEICYVLDRKNQTKFIGNTLEKPQILLKRTFIRDTTFDKENLEQDQDFKDGERMRMDEMASGGMRGTAHAPMSSLSRTAGAGGTQTMNNFLEYPSYVLSNLRVDNNNCVVIPEFPAHAFSNVEVILTNFSSVVGGFYPLSLSAVPKKDLRMQSTLKKGEFYTTGRNFTSVLRKNKGLIPADAQSFIFDSLSQVFAAQKELIQCAKGSDTENGVGFDFWKFLPDWQTLSPTEKMNKYNEFACHELNIFLYLKDQEFFNGVVTPFISNKIEKTFVDFFLLGMEKETNSFAETSQFEDLNAMEKSLLLLSLMQTKQALRAQALADQITKSVKCTQVDTQFFNQLFDTVILAQKQTLDNKPKLLSGPPPPPPGAFLSLQSSLVRDQEIYSPQVQQCDFMCDDAEENLCEEQESQAPRMMMQMAAPAMRSMAVNRDFDRLGGEFSDQLQKKQKEFKPGFQNLDKTKEYVERTYYGQTETSFKYLIQENLFWSDLAEHIVKTGSTQNFLSQNFILSTSCHAEMVTVLGFLDISFENSDYQMVNVPVRKLEITSTDQNNLLIFLKEVKLGTPQLNSGITIAQRFFDPKDQYYENDDDPGVQIAQKVDEFLVDRVYGCQVVISNGSASNLELQILTEIPDGAMPIRSIDFSKTYIRYLNSFNTNSLQYYFYFPGTGQFNVYPANVSRGDRVMGIASDSEQFVVLTEKTIKKLETFRDILMNGKESDILQFVSEKNILNPEVFNWNDILWKLKDPKFYQAFIKILKDRGIYSFESWKYSFMHEDLTTIYEVLNQETYLLSNYFDKMYFSAGPIVYDPHRVFEYHPILSSRSHNFMNQKNKILNVQFKQTYTVFLNYLLSVPKLQNSHYLVWCYYLLLQERIQETMAIFAKINKTEIAELKTESRLQYDYMAAYLDIYSGHPKFTLAREISSKYLQYPILSWRNLFKDIANQLAEYDGVFVDEADKVTDNEINKNAKSADAEETLSFQLDQTELVIYYQNLSTIQINYYELDLEVLFSRSPFIKQEANSFSYVSSNHSEVLHTSKLSTQQKVKSSIPLDLQKKNLLIQVSCENKLLSTTYFSSSFQVHLIENYGQVQVTDSQNKPLSKVYVQCFAKDNSNNVAFYRDGYTDLRGRFDYALSSASNVDNIVKFSVLVYSEQHGANILEAGQPNSQGTFES